MFAKAYSIACQFTRPIVISYRQANGNCSAVIGTVVIINEEGWFVTAFHILKSIQDMSQSLAEYNRVLSIRKQIEDNTNLKHHERARQLNINKIPPNLITNYSIWCGHDGLQIGNLGGIPSIDLGVGKISNFDKALISVYPKFKDPSKPMEICRSLCKLGFPFHSIIPVFHQATNSFELPAGSVPLPFFPIDGIFTRQVLSAFPNTPDNPRNYPLLLIETSTPGLKGQSGGPTFDVEGNIWAIQSQTRSYSLGFEANNANWTQKQKEHYENEHFHVGLGIHTQTIIGFLRENNIKFNLSLH